MQVLLFCIDISSIILVNIKVAMGLWMFNVSSNEFWKVVLFWEIVLFIYLMHLNNLCISG